ncbi:hypothetical protein N7471_005834 [Penicillium samsonianum]|uniref:uncharacterized protein n=1 Tax=Penicillium samsonianum TaxID=1882272 RepID=UPI002546C742|nr:uncharacterized protein N7471_005834 [Penicillium samsonianum]KAJ6139348.1 hypothetical protein N7471_005834 [Penicillium samsonianum]
MFLSISPPSYLPSNHRSSRKSKGCGNTSSPWWRLYAAAPTIVPAGKICLPRRRMDDEEILRRADREWALGGLVGFPVAATTTQHGFELYTANSIRIAAYIGLIIDAEDASPASPDRTTAISVRCQSHSDRAVLDRTLDMLPEIYRRHAAPSCPINSVPLDPVVRRPGHT